MVYSYLAKRTSLCGIIALSLLAPLRLLGQSCTTASCTAVSMNESDVVAAWPTAGNTNSTFTLILPAGTGHWTTMPNLTVPNGVTNMIIQGATTTSCTGTAGTSSYNCTATDASIIIDDITTGTNHYAVWQINGNTVNSSKFKMTGVTIQGGVGLQKYGQGTIAVFGNAAPNNFIFENNHINQTTYSGGGGPGTFAIHLNGCVRGVADQNLFDNAVSTSTSAQAQSYIADNNCNDITGGYGDGSWAVPTNFGSSDFFFFERNKMVGGIAAGDCDNGGKVVDRYNTIVSSTTVSSWVHNHGTEHNGGRTRGCRAYEAYNNWFVEATGSGSVLFGSAGGPSLVWGNGVNTTVGLFAGVGIERNDGQHPEVASPAEWGFCGTSTPDPNAGGAPNGVGSNWDGNTPGTTGAPCLDDIGRGQNLVSLNGQPFPNAGQLGCTVGSTCAPFWPSQYSEPIYYWMNNRNGTPQLTITGTSAQQNRDIYVDSASFNGTSGTGYGLLAARPTTCTAGPGGAKWTSPTGSYGVAYFATDANSGNGELYVCDSTNHWTPYYQPYQNPHPLSGSAVCSLSFIPAGGSYSTTQTVTIATSGCPTGTKVFYRTDGLPATNADTMYAGPITVSSTQTLTAKAVLNPTVRDQPQTIATQKKCNVVGSPITFPSGYSCTNGSGGVAGTVSDFKFTPAVSNQLYVTTTDSSAYDASVLLIDTPTVTDDNIVEMTHHINFKDTSNCTQSAGNLFKCIDVSETDSQSCCDATTHALWQMSVRCSVNQPGVPSTNNGFLEGDASSGSEKWDIPCVIGTQTDLTVNSHWTLGDTACGGAGCMVLDSIYLNGTKYAFPASCDPADTNCPNYPMTAQPTYGHFVAGSQEQVYARNVGVAGISPLTTTRNISFDRVAVDEGTQASGTSAYTISGATYTFTQAVNPSAAGTITGFNSGTNSYPANSTIGPLTATPAAGYSFASWTSPTGSAVGICTGTTNPTASFPLTANSSCTAVFSANNYIITTVANPTSGGSVSGCLGNNTYGSTFTCSVTVNAGYSLSSITGCGGTLSGSTYSGTMPANNCVVTLNLTSPTCGDPTQLGPNYSGSYTSPPTTLPLNVGFSSPTSGCGMHYTSDGSAPTCSSAAYPVGGFNLNSSTVVRVIACQTGYTSSNIIGGGWNISVSGTHPPSNLIMTVVH